MAGEEKMFGHEHVQKMTFTARQGDPGACVCGTREDGRFWCSGEGSALEMRLHAEKLEAMKKQTTVGDLSRTGTIEPMKNTIPSHTCRCMSVGDLSKSSLRDEHDN